MCLVMYRNAVGRNRPRKQSGLIEGLKRLNPRAVAFFGSCGMGLADKYSHDVDIVIHADRIPSTRAKHEVFSSISDGSIPSITLPYDADIFARDREFCEVVFKTRGKIELDVSELVEGKADHEEEVAIFVYYTKILYDDGWLRAQKARIQKYPQKLLATNLFSCLFSALRQVHYYDRAINKRKQPYWGELCINDGLNSLMHALFAANKTYYGKHKWAEVQCMNFKLKPKDFEQRLVRVMKGRDITAYKRLALDVCTLCQKYYPEECAEVIAVDSRLRHIDDYIESLKR